MQKRFFLIIILMFSSHTYASPKPIEAEQLNSRALMAEAEYNLLPLSLVFVDGKYNKIYVDEKYDQYSPIFQENRIDYFFALKRNGRLEEDIKKGKDYIANNSCEENQSSCVYIMKRIIDMNKLAIMVNNGYSKSDIKKALFNQKELNYNKNLLMNKYIEQYKAIMNEKSRE
ncbi:hypothetical protein JEJ96_01395 [Klebsiella pneumoniae]|uniref:hypothetical protein n=1 Tax=Klebsiella TaxID=570 RepID=UPI00164A2E67|nr:MULTISPECIES: hypothetical protein [Klebsiella]MBC4396880.1 hypothetical protein [Klebsiella pneumoniae]MCQ8574952.1 hypothetical protein [Klebsiella pneumoniae]UYH05579.1 hypothetical protein NQA44_03800 [Klebsiella oxytoca]HBS5876181.1 hypothetical protein [Klebsiella pneumoniae]HDW1391253.1 hypothetical protein [Klebsiella oxytoca]